MANKRTKQKKTKQSTSGQKGGSASLDNIGSPSPVRKQKKKK